MAIKPIEGALVLIGAYLIVWYPNFSKTNDNFLQKINIKFDRRSIVALTATMMPCLVICQFILLTLMGLDKKIVINITWLSIILCPGIIGVAQVSLRKKICLLKNLAQKISTKIKAKKNRKKNLENQKKRHKKNF